jgi:hypothetical protein
LSSHEDRHQAAATSMVDALSLAFSRVMLMCCSYETANAAIAVPPTTT